MNQSRSVGEKNVEKGEESKKNRMRGCIMIIAGLLFGGKEQK